MKRLLTIALLALAALAPAGAQRLGQKLGRGVVATCDPAKSEVFVSWRRLAQESEGCKYNVWARQGGGTYTKLNAEPLAHTNWTGSRSALPYGSEVAVSRVDPDGTETAPQSPFLFRQQQWRNVFFDFDFDSSVLNCQNYRCKYVRPCDLDGDGETDAVLATRHCYSTATDPTIGGVAPNKNDKLQMYKLDGTLLWTLDIGPNIQLDAGSADNVTVFDIDCDGRTEVILKTSDGTRFWDAAANTWGAFAHFSATADTDGDGISDYTKQSQRNPPYYISVLDGTTGAEKDCAELRYADVKDTRGDDYRRDNRADYYDDGEGKEYAFMTGAFCICYFDGIHPSLAIEARDRRRDNGHHYYFFAFGYDWAAGAPTNWHHDYTWSRNDKTPWPAEFHQLRVADTDGDGIDEMLDGGYGVNSAKGMVYSAGIGHGDRFDVSDIDPDRPGLECYAIQQTALLGQLIYDTRTGEHIKEWYLPSVADVGRGRCMDVDAAHKGYEVFSTMGNLYDCKGNLIKEGAMAYPVEAVWWDGNLQRELIGSPGGSGYGTNVMVQTFGGDRLIQFSKESAYAVHCGGAVRPAYMGDMTGDWREELILMRQTEDHSDGLIGYTTDIPTTEDIYCLGEDQHYLLDQTNRCYYQAPCTGFYLGGDMPYPPLPPTMKADVRYAGGGAWAAGAAGFTSFDMRTPATFADGQSAIFDISGSNAQPIDIAAAVRPAATYIMAPAGHDYTFAGTGSIAGAGDIWKSLQGKATIDCDIATTGTLNISEGTLEANAKVDCPVSLRAKGTLAGTPAISGAVEFEGALNYEGCRLMPGSQAQPYGAMTFRHSLALPGNVYIECRAGAEAGQCSHIVVEGDLTLAGSNTFNIGHTGAMAEGDYVLAECTGKLTADPAKLMTMGLTGINYTIGAADGKIVLTVRPTRAPAEGVEWTGNESGEWNYQAENFTLAGQATAFVAGDKVVFGDNAATRSIDVPELMVAGDVRFDFSGAQYTLAGTGGISGATGLTKDGTGTLSIDTQENEYTGTTQINAGTIAVPELRDGGKASALGAGTSIKFGRGQLKVTGISSATDRTIALGADTATINISKDNGSMSLKGKVTGSGRLVKEGPGQLNFTYPGTNPFNGIIVRGGRIAQGAWNSTFGYPGSDMRLEGNARVSLIDVNSMSTVPSLDHKMTIVGEGNQIDGSTRGAIKGSMLGDGTVAINSFGVRSDIYTDFSAFTGTLHFVGENCRLMQGVTDMAKGNLVLDAGAKVGHRKGGANDEVAATMKLGSLAATATDCSLGNSKDSYEIGYNGASTTYKGRFTAAKITKVGEGKLTITGTESTSPIYVKGGVLRLSNASGTTAAPLSATSGGITVQDGGTLCGMGQAGDVAVNAGGILTGGDGMASSFKSKGNIVVKKDGILMVKLTAASNDKFKAAGTLRLTDAIIRIVVAPDRELKAGDKITVFNGTNRAVGTYTIETEGYNATWDDSTLLTDGTLTVVEASPTGIAGTKADSTKVNVYATDGTLLRYHADSARALEGLPKGVYIVGGKKQVRQ